MEIIIGLEELKEMINSIIGEKLASKGMRVSDITGEFIIEDTDFFSIFANAASRNISYKATLL